MPNPAATRARMQILVNRIKLSRTVDDVGMVVECADRFLSIFYAEETY